MSTPFDENCIDRWLEDFDAFRVEFLEVCHPVCMALGYELDFNQRQLETAHVAWRASHDLWKNHKVAKTTSQLSHIKIMALLLYQLCKVTWIRNLYEYNGDYHKFNGSPETRAETAKDLNSGREAFLALHFCVMTINWFEVHRDDRIDPFVFRMSEDLNFDMMHFLLEQEKTETAIFLILKALYARD